VRATHSVAPNSGKGVQAFHAYVADETVTPLAWGILLWLTPKECSKCRQPRAHKEQPQRPRAHSSAEATHASAQHLNTMTAHRQPRAATCASTHSTTHGAQRGSTGWKLAAGPLGAEDKDDQLPRTHMMSMSHNSSRDTLWGGRRWVGACGCSTGLPHRTAAACFTTMAARDRPP
jgi:hypothetical protein